MAMVERNMLFSVCLRPVSDFSIAGRFSKRHNTSWKLSCSFKPKLKITRSRTNPNSIFGNSDDYFNWRIKTQEWQFIHQGSCFIPGKPWIRINPNPWQGVAAGFRTLNILPHERRPVVRSSGSTCCAVTWFLPGISTEKDVERLEHAKSDVAIQDDEEGVICERERMRRHKISVANKGRVPWNKGGKHSPQTIERIRERTYQAMRSPKVIAKLKLNSRHPQTDETRSKIREKLKGQWEAKKRTVRQQDSLVKDWGECVAEAARKGGLGEGEMEWNSYSVIKKKMRIETASLIRSQKAKQLRLEKLERDKAMGIRPGKSDEHRQKISAAIRAKWADPEYQNKVREGMIKKTGTARVRRKPQTPRPPKPPHEKLPKTPRQPAMKGPVGPVDKGFITAVMSAEKRRKPVVRRAGKEDDDGLLELLMSKKRTRRKVNLLKRHMVPGNQVEENLTEVSRTSSEGVTVSGVQTFVDPLAIERLQTLKLHEANRSAMDERRREAIHHARTLMAKAEDAARMLEEVAGSDESARASLIETQRILAEAAQFMRIAESVKGHGDVLYAYIAESHNGATPENTTTSHQSRESQMQIDIREHHESLHREDENFTLRSNSATVLEADKYLHSSGCTS